MSYQLSTFNFQLSTFVFSAASLLLLITSCTDKQSVARTASLDSLETAVGNLKQKLESVGLHTVQQCSDSAASNLSFVLQNYTDTMSRELSIFLSDYRALKKPLAQFAGQYKRYEERVGRAIKQLSDLRHDTEHRIISDSLFQTYYHSEKKTIRDMQQDLENAVNIVISKLRLFDSLNPEVVRLIDSLKTAGVKGEKK